MTVKIGQVIYWKTMFGEWFKGEVTAMDATNFYVTRLVPHIAYGVAVPRTAEIY